MVSKLYQLTDRETGRLLASGLTGEAVVDDYVDTGQRSAGFSLINTMKVDQEMSLGKIIVRRMS